MRSLSLDAAVVPRHYRVVLTELGGQCVGDQVVAMLESDLDAFKTRLADAVKAEFATPVTVDVFAA